MRAFTLIELLIVVAIGTLIFASAAPLAGRFQADSQVNEMAALLSEDLRLVAQDSQSGWQDASYGIKFLPGRYLVYRGSSYASRDITQDRVVSLANNLSFDLLLNSQGDEIAFDRRGLTQSFGMIKINHAAGSNKTLSINSLGVVSAQ